MSREVVFTPLATADVERAVYWYEQQRPGLGTEFEAAVDQLLALVQAMPEIGPVKHHDLRWILLVRFPYAIYYRVGDKIEIRACLHLRRSPKAWRRRLRPNEEL